MKYVCSLIAVKDMESSKRFYRDILGCEVELDFGANVTLSGGFCLQTLDSWQGFIGREATLGGASGEMYFEVDDLDGFCKRLEQAPQVEYVHPLREHSWGQRCVRFYDPDRHMIEVGEGLDAVARRFANEGMTIAQTALRMDVAEDYVRTLLK